MLTRKDLFLIIAALQFWADEKDPGDTKLLKLYADDPTADQAWTSESIQRLRKWLRSTHLKYAVKNAAGTVFLTPELFATLETAEQASHENNRTLSLVTGVILGGRSLREQLSSMHEDLQVSSPTANQSLRNLIGGEIILEEFDIPLRKRKALRGTFTLTAHGVSGEVVNGSPTQNASEHAKLISIDFIQPDATENQRKIANDMYDNGEPIKNIAEALNVGRSRVILLLHEAFEILGLEKPDGRQRRWQLDTAHQKPLFHQNIADNVMELFHKKKTYGEIARQLGVDRNVITAAVKFWHQQKGLPVPDGRSRRKTL